jgi:hypothetical protein
MTMEFNEKFNDKGEKPRFIYKPSPLVARSYQIFEYKAGKENYEPVGEYIVLDADEDIDLSEKKMVNLISILNGKKDLIDLGNLTKTRLLFNIVPRASDSDPTKIIFRTHDGAGVSKENAVMTIEKGVLNEE